MLLQNWRGFAGLPSQHCPGNKHFPDDFAEIESLESPSKGVESSRRNHQPSRPFSAVELKRSDMSRALPPEILFPSKITVKGTSGSLELSTSRSRAEDSSRESPHPKHPQRARPMSPPQGIHSKGSRRYVSDGTEYQSSAVRRWHSSYRLPNWNPREHSPTQPLARKRQSCSELGLQASLPEELQRTREVGETSCVWNLELTLNLMHFELLSLKQKQMESSFAHIEKEKQWLEMTHSEDRKQKGDLDDKIFSLETEPVKTRSSISKRNHRSLSSLDAKQNAPVEKKDIDQELVILQRNLVAQENHIKDLEGKQEEMQQKLETTQEEKNRLEEKVRELSLKLAPALSDRERLLQEKVAVHQELECVLEQQEGFSDQVSALHSELVSAKTQVIHQDKEMVLMKEELESTRQACRALSSEVAESRQKLEASLEKLHLSEAEKKTLKSHVQALEKERTQLLEEADGRGAPPGQEEEGKPLQETSANLRESRRLLQREEDVLQAPSLELEAALQAKQEEVGSRLTSQEHISQSRRGRQGQGAAAAKTEGEELEKTSALDLSAKKPRSKKVAGTRLGPCRHPASLPTQVHFLPQGQSQDSDAKVTRSPQGEQERLRRQHQLVTEQLKMLFRQQQAQCRMHPGGSMGESSVVPLKLQEMLTVAKPIKLPEDCQAELQDVPGTSGEAQSLQQQLREKTEIIASMASEIQALKQKNDALMKAKLRFQQQIEEIRRFSKQGAERSKGLVPQFSTNPDQDLQSACGCNSPVPLSQRDELTPSISRRENQAVAAQEAQLHPGAEDERSRGSSDTSVACLSASSSAVHGDLLSAGPLPSPPGSSCPTVPSIMLSLPPLPSHQESQGHLEGEGPLLSPRSSALLSPRPFGSPRPWSPFKFRASPEPSED